MGLTIVENEPLAKYTAWRIGGPARFFANARAPEELIAALEWARDRETAVFVLGGGTNLLIRDAGFDGLVLRYRAQDVDVESAGGEGRARIAAGAPMAGTVRRLAARGWGGLQWAEGLPGTIGGAVYGNAGCYGGDIAAGLARAWLLVGGAVEEWPVERLGYGYRTSALKRANAQRPTPEDATAAKPTVSGPSPVVPIVVAAEFKLYRADPRELAAQMERTAAERKSKTPIGSSCGSVFKNPPGGSAGRLIEAAGLKGTRVGGAQIAERHANYIVNVGRASSDDILRLVEIARERVAAEFGVELELEVQVIG